MKPIDLEHMTDEELVFYVRTRDKEAYSEIVSRYRPRLERYIRSFTHDEAVISDVVQESLIGAFIHLQNFDIRHKFSSWIYRIAHNIAMNQFSRRPQGMPFDDELFVTEGDAMREIERHEIDDRVRARLAELPAEYASALALHFLEGYSYREIARILHYPIGTVGTKINRAKIMLKKLCTNEN